jgi:PAS domain S-box-containing protein
MKKRKTDLKKAVEKLSKSKTETKKIAALNSSFELFNKETTRLEKAYKALMEQFKSVHVELKTSNKELYKKVLQLDTITRYLNGILTNISQGIIFIDLSGTITTYNETAENILDIKNYDVLLNSFWEHFDDDIFGFSMKEALRTRQAPSSLFVNIKTKSGNRRELEVNTKFVLNPYHDAIAPHLDTLEYIQGIIILIHDLTEIRYLQTLANRNDRMKELGEMAAMLAHEIRNPLGGIKGFASLLQRDLKDNPRLYEMASYIVQGAENLNNLVTQVLNYSRPFKAHFESVDIIHLIHELEVHLKADKIMHDKIKFEVVSKLKSLVLPADNQLLRSALLNIIVNAIQAMPKGGKITLEVSQLKNKAFIKISDTGIGIAEEDLEKIFTPFFTTKTDGNGLGLCEAHKVIQVHAGKLEVASKPNKGAAFTIELPMRAFAGS